MKLANYVYEGTLGAGIIRDSKVYAVRRQDDSTFTSVDEILSSGSIDWVSENQSRLVEDDNGVPIESVGFKSPVLNPEKIYLAAVNYLSHGNEQNVSPPTEPYFFTKFRNALIGNGDDILLPKISKKVDWEAEFAVIIGKKGKNIPKQKAMDYVAGYTVANDISFRDIRGGSSDLGRNWVKAKGLDSSLPLGPWLVTKEEMTDPYASEISLTVNGVQKQRSKIGEMVFKIDALIEYLSADVTLAPGDVISTGTPQGVAAFSGGPYLKDGDIVEASIQGIGRLRNVVRAQSY
jgi:2-keto-4-pentenoate hydratase/2-oxohepta-3-ene-1,7-dioic acid hydratase in catechol pathway